MTPVEEATVSAFVLPRRRARYLSLLESKRGRKKFRQELAHFHDFDPRFSKRIPADRQTVAGIEAMLRQLGAPARCTILSEADGIDGTDLDLGAALAMVIGHGSGTILSCLHGSLAYYESEEPEERFILQRNSSG